MNINTADQVDTELAMIRQTSTRLRSAVSRVTWQVATQRRWARIGSLVLMLPRLVAQRVQRVRIDAGWLVSLDGTPVLTIASHTKGKTLADLQAPLPVHVHQPDLMDLSILEELESAGTIVIVHEAP